MENFIPRSFIDPKNFDELNDLIGQLHLSRNNTDSVIRTFSGNSDIVKVLNKIFNDKNCVGFTFTENIDNDFFGVYVNPTITNSDLMNILVGTDEYQLDRYQVELDSKLLDMAPDYVAAYIVEDVANTMCTGAINNLRAYIDELMLKFEDNINIRNAVNSNALLIWGLKDALHKLNSMKYRIFNTEMVGLSKYAQAFNTHDSLTVCADIVKQNTVGLYAHATKPDMSLLQWIFMVYSDINGEYRNILEMLKESKPLTGSKLMKAEIDRALKALSRVSSEVLRESVEVLEEAKRMSMFKQLKQNGLRAVEDQLYEFKVRIKNCTSEDEAMFIMRNLSANLAILQDYVENTPNLSESEIARWEEDIDEYRNLRRELGTKKFMKADSFLNYDYSKLDALDNPY